MKYNELIQFESIETIIQFLDANNAAPREKLVKDYVISEEMAYRINNIIFPQLQFNDPSDNKGLLVVGNYGTGKSHLMAVISGIAEDASLVNFLKSEEVKKNVTQIAGRFKVIRTELGSTTRTLREAIVSELDNFLEDNGIDYKFPSTDAINNHYEVFATMMDAFDKKFPDKGLLFVVDELLDFLRHRDQQQLIFDLSFLREIGQVCKNLRFRFIAGVQEAIFDSSLFSFYSDEIRRVRERFETVSIVKEDIKYVISQRLLKKNAGQESKIREHLAKFTKYYGGMNEKLNEFVQLFPIHPDYIDTLAALTIAEKRTILKSLSLEMKAILDKNIPDDEPGLIAFDAYWSVLCDDPSFRTLENVKAVIDCSRILEERVKNSLPHKQYKPVALRIIHGLSLHRLTVGDINSPVGATAEELRDRLCLYDTTVALLGSNEPDRDLLTHIETVLKEIYSTVSGQFISQNKDNFQYYFDLKKNDDYDAKIEERAASLSPAQLDECYYQALMSLLECPTGTCRNGFKIWTHDIMWYSHKASRSGYLFLGAPNERSTTVPARDFYMYFLEPFEHYGFTDEKRKDEVFFTLTDKDEKFEEILKLYGGAVKQVETSSMPAKQMYQSRADVYLKQLRTWFLNNYTTALSVTYQGQAFTLGEFTAKRDFRAITGIGDKETINIKDFLDTVAEQCLDPYFNDLTPDYPSFSIKVTSSNREQNAQEAIKAMATGNFSYQAKAILSALDLYDGTRLTPSSSRYARYILDLKKNKADGTPRQNGQVINRDEIFSSTEDTIEYYADKKSRLEGEWVMVVIAALVSAGEVVLATSTAKYDAGKLSGLAAELAKEGIGNLIRFKHLEQSKEYNLPALQSLFSLFNLPEGKATLIATQGDAGSVADLQNEIEKIVQKIVTQQKDIQSGITFWGFNILELLNFNAELASLKDAKNFFESLERFDSAGKMKNLNYSKDDIEKYRNIPAVLAILDELLIFSQKNSSLALWFQQAVEVYAPAHPWVLKTEKIQEELKQSLRSISPVTIETVKGFEQDAARKTGALKDEYIADYSALHSAVRFNSNDEKRKKRILSDVRYLALENLAKINILPVRQVEEFKKRLDDMKVCTEITTAELKSSPICSHCHYAPIRDGITGGTSHKIDEAEESLDKMISDWTDTLLKNLDDAYVKKNMDLLKPTDRNLLVNFISSGRLPSPVSGEFIIALKETFSKLDKVSVSAEDIHKVLRSGGPVTPDELKDIFVGYIDKLTEGKDWAKIRIVVE
jgi:energy-coupling factor transporter ATP-binding protein EcfA2